jgi:hypothetical protein
MLSRVALARHPYQATSNMDSGVITASLAQASAIDGSSGITSASDADLKHGATLFAANCAVVTRWRPKCCERKGAGRWKVSGWIKPGCRNIIRTVCPPENPLKFFSLRTIKM